MKVTLFATCFVDMFQSNVGKATVELLGTSWMRN